MGCGATRQQMKTAGARDECRRAKALEVLVLIGSFLPPSHPLRPTIYTLHQRQDGGIE
jgi:hypothetical protein